MLKNHFLIAWRNLQKHRTSALINIGGLALGLATSVLILLYLVDEFNYDKFHKDLPNLYLVMKNQRQANGVSTGGNTAGPLAKALSREVPAVKYSAREAAVGEQMVRTADKSLYIDGTYAEPELFKMMTFPSVAGDPVTALADPHSVILTESAAKKIFGQADPMGQTLVLNDTMPLKVAAILRDIPANSSVRLELVLPFSVFEQANPWLKKWDDNRIRTWLQLQPSADVAAVNEKMTTMLQTRSDDSTVSLFAYPMARLRLYSGFQNGKQSGGRINLIVLMIVMGSFVLLIACINFMNIATARSEYRAREVGVRKVLGALRKTIIHQFLCEALIMAFISLALGILLSRIALPVVNHFSDKTILFNFQDWRIWLGLLLVGLITGLVAGSYPALFLSRSRPVLALKSGVQPGTGRPLLRRILVTIQFWVSIFFIIGTIVIYQQIEHVKNRPVGYDQENLIDIRTNGRLGADFPLFANEMGKIPGVSNV